MLETCLPDRRPATLAATVTMVSQILKRPIHIVVGDPEGLPNPTATWVRTPRRDLLWADSHLSPVQLIAAILHELAHMLCNHTPEPVDPDAGRGAHTVQIIDPVSKQPVLAALGRCHPGVSVGSDTIEAQTARAALELHQAGHSFNRIAEAVGVSEREAERLVKLACEVEAEITGRLLGVPLLYAQDAWLAWDLDRG
jgi:hypothetical protein